MIDVEQRALRALEEHALGVAQRLVDGARRVREQARDAVGGREDRVDHLVDARHRAAQREDGGLPDGERALDAAPQGRGIAQEAGADAAASCLVLVRGPDAALGRPDLAAARRLAEAIDELVVREDQVRPLGHEQIARRVAPAQQELVELAAQRGRVDDHALAQHAPHAGAQDAARHEAHHHLLVAHVEGVAGVGAARVADDEVREFGEEVYDLPLPLVPPLCSDDRYGGHRLSLAHVAGRTTDSAHAATVRSLAPASAWHVRVPVSSRSSTQPSSSCERRAL